MDMGHIAKTLFAALVLPLAAACGGGDKAALEEDVELRTGRYEGLLPAADCPGIEVVLDVMEGDSFVVEMRYLERDTFTVRGNYRLSGNVLAHIALFRYVCVEEEVRGASLPNRESHSSPCTSISRAAVHSSSYHSWPNLRTSGSRRNW